MILNIVFEALDQVSSELFVVHNTNTDTISFRAPRWRRNPEHREEKEEQHGCPG
jgi:hypothetical protein